jgi:hypothetical protein
LKRQVTNYGCTYFIAAPWKQKFLRANIQNTQVYCRHYMSRQEKFRERAREPLRREKLNRYFVGWIWTRSWIGAGEVVKKQELL